MGHASYPATGVASSTSVVSGQARKRIGKFFASIVTALHESRRLQAQRTLYRYRHLLARFPASEVRDHESKDGRS